VSIVLVFNPATKCEPGLTLAGQVQQVFGPFGSDDLAEAFVQQFIKRFGPKSMNGMNWEFLIIPLESPRSISPRHENN
jgi:hypothetical protein